MRVSINILTWNTFKVTHDTLHALKDDLKDIEHEVIIVDNGSTDGCQDLATVKNPYNMGVSIGKNQGIEASKGEYILMLDGDILYVPGSIKCLMAWLDEHPQEYAIGFYPNKFTRQRNTFQKQHEERCFMLHEPKEHTTVCLFYGLFRRSMFEKGIKCDTSGPFAKVGYAWEDTDLYYQMKFHGIKQWVAGINSAIGKYYHEINSSIKQMGHEVYIDSSKTRHEYFKKKWAIA